MLAVLAGAFGAHALRGQVTEEAMAVYQTGALYHFLHALGLLVIGALKVTPPMQVRVCRAGLALLIGMVIFSGSLYALAVTQWRWLGMITPFGGVALVLGWLQLALCVPRILDASARDEG